MKDVGNIRTRGIVAGIVLIGAFIAVTAASGDLTHPAKLVEDVWPAVVGGFLVVFSWRVNHDRPLTAFILGMVASEVIYQRAWWVALPFAAGLIALTLARHWKPMIEREERLEALTSQPATPLH